MSTKNNKILNIPFLKNGTVKTKIQIKSVSS